MTQQEFEAECTKVWANEHSTAVFGVTHVSMPCHCDYAPEVHWAAIRNTAEAIREHVEHDALCIELYHPELHEGE